MSSRILYMYFAENFPVRIIKFCYLPIYSHAVCLRIYFVLTLTHTHIRNIFIHIHSNKMSLLVLQENR